MRILLSSLFVTTQIVQAVPAFAETTVQTINAECTTEATGGDGVRHGCDSDWSELNAPPGFVFAKNTFAAADTSANGSEHECRVAWGKEVEVIPGSGITQPSQLRVQAHARSPKGHFKGRGWQHCKYTVGLAKYSQ